MSDKEFFDRFRQDAATIEQTPTPPTWSRIERRIQPQRPATRWAASRQLPRPLAIAAALALVLGLTVVFLWLSDQQNGTGLAQTRGPLKMEELTIEPIAASTTTPARTIAVAQKLLTPAKPINEGNASQRLVAKNEVRTDGQKTTTPRTDSTRQEREDRTGK